MRSKQLIEAVSEITGFPYDTVSDILFVLPDVLLDMEEGETVSTSLGVFRMFRTSPRTVIIPETDIEVHIPSQMTVKLRPGKRLRR